MGLMKIRRGALSSSVAANALYPLTKTGALTVSNLITDSTRLTGTQGDGAAYPASSAGVWPAATNLVTNGGFETNTTGWQSTGAGVISGSSSTEKAKFGSRSLKVSIDGTSGNQGFRLSTGLSAATSTTYTCSVWIWAPTGHTIECAIDQTLANAYVSTLVTANVVGNNDWQRVLLTGTTAASGIDGLRPYFRRAASGAAIAFYADGVQLETGSIATPYIETDGGTASRSAGSITMPASVLDETQMWVAVCVTIGSTSGGSNRIFSWGDDANNRIEMILGSATNKPYMLRVAAGTGPGAAAISGTAAVGDTVVCMVGMSATSVYCGWKGQGLSEVADTNIPTISSTQPHIGRQGFSSFGWLAGSVKWCAVGKGPPTNALENLVNNFGGTDPLPHMFPRSAQLTFLAHFNGDGAAYRYKA